MYRMKVNKQILASLPWLFLIIVYVTVLGFFACFGAYNLNADDSSEMILAQQLNEEGTFLSKEWLYSTEIRVISPVPLYQLGLLLFDSWRIARIFAQACCLMGIALAALYFAYSLGIKAQAPYLAAVLLLPYSKSYAFIVVQGLFYAVHIMLALVMMGLIFRITRERPRRQHLILLALLGLYSGLGGIRMMTMIILPLCMAAGYQAFCAFKRYETYKQAAHEPEVRMAGSILLCAAFACAGYIYNALVLSNAYSYADYTDIQMGRADLIDLIEQLKYIVHQMGYRNFEPLFSLKGIGSCMAVLLTGMMFFATLHMLKRRDALSPELRLLALTTGIAVVLGMLLNVFLDLEHVRYFMVGLMLMELLVFIAILVEPCRNAHLRALCFGVALICILFQTANVMRYDYRRGMVNYNYAADWLLDHGYTQGYATFWNANTITEASNGQIEMWVLNDEHAVVQEDGFLKMQPTLQAKRHLTEDPQGKVFLLVDDLELEAGSPLFLPEHYVDMIAWSYYIYEFDSTAQMREILATAASGQ